MASDQPDFEALRAARNAAADKWRKDFAAKNGLPLSKVQTSHNDHACYCDCANHGPCEHKWDGEWWTSEDGCASSATCSRCGITAMSHDMRVLP